MEIYIKDLYLNKKYPTFYSGVKAVYNQAKNKFPKIKVKDVLDVLLKIDTYTLHKPLRRHATLRTISAGLDCDHQIDICDVQSLRKFNDNHGYILTNVDVLSGYLWAFPLIRKTPKDVLKAYKQILHEGRKPWRLFSDQGNEFKGEFKQFLLDNEIKNIYPKNPDVKASVVERANRTLKGRLYHYFTHTNSWRWLEILPNAVRNINKSFNRSIGMAPVSVTHANDNDVYKRKYAGIKEKILKNRKKKGKFKIGDSVRISIERSVFKRGFTKNFSVEIFVIFKRENRDRVVYRIKDQSGEEIEGIFYPEELVKVNRNGEGKNTTKARGKRE